MHVPFKIVARPMAHVLVYLSTVLILPLIVLKVYASMVLALQDHVLEQPHAMMKMHVPPTTVKMGNANPPQSFAHRPIHVRNSLVTVRSVVSLPITQSLVLHHLV